MFNIDVVLGTDMEQMFMTFNASLAQHIDPDEPVPTVGLWGNLGNTGSVIGGEFVFSRRNLVIPINPKGTLIIWFGEKEEHGTAALKFDEGMMRCAAVIGRKGEFEKIREEKRFTVVQ